MAVDQSDNFFRWLNGLVKNVSNLINRPDFNAISHITMSAMMLLHEKYKAASHENRPCVRHNLRVAYDTNGEYFYAEAFNRRIKGISPEAVCQAYDILWEVGFKK